MRCKLDLMIWRRLVLRFCIRPLNGAFVLLAIMDSRSNESFMNPAIARCKNHRAIAGDMTPP